MHVLLNQRLYLSICYGATYSKQNGELSLIMSKIDEHIITIHKNDVDKILLYGNERYRHDTYKIIYY